VEDEREVCVKKEFDARLSEAKAEFMSRVCELVDKHELKELKLMVDGFTSEVMFNGYLNGFALAILEHRGCDTFDDIVEEIERQESKLKSNPEWASGLEPHGEVYRRGALTGFRLALKGNVNDPDFVHTKQIVEALEAQD
jgi:hypothetical protein